MQWLEARTEKKKEAVLRYQTWGLLILAAGCLVAAFSVSISVQANVLMNSGEAFVKALADTIHVRFGTVKLSYDISLVILIALLLLSFFLYREDVNLGVVVE